jgi:hypothetical protein
MRIGGRGDCIPFPNSKSSLTNAPSVLQACSKHVPGAKVKRYREECRTDAKTMPGNGTVLLGNFHRKLIANNKSRITERKPMSPNRIETAEDLELIVAAQTTAIDALKTLVQGQHSRIKILTALIDEQYEILIRAGLAKPRPTEDHLVN